MEDAENKIRSLNNRIIDLEAQLRNARSSSSVNISASSGSGNVQEYEIIIKTLNSRIQKLKLNLMENLDLLNSLKRRLLNLKERLNLAIQEQPTLVKLEV